MYDHIRGTVATDTNMLCRRLGCIADIYGVDKCDHCECNHDRCAFDMGMCREARLRKNHYSFFVAACALALAVAGLWATYDRDALAQAIGQSLFGQMQTGAPLGPAISPQIEPLTGIYFGTGRTGIARHLEGGNTNANNVPVISACGTGPTLAAGSTDFAGQYTTGTVTTTCTLTFGTAYAAAPTCMQSAQGSATQPTFTTSTTALTNSVDAVTTTYSYICIARQGG